MSELKLENYIMPAAKLGPDSPLPPLDICLPYTLQNNYNREKKITEFKTVVLENDILKATFLIEFGGRLWSLFHKKAKRELLYTNPVFQPCNLAIRNAWFSGGVEWNIGLHGHSVFTCSPLYVSKLKMDDGTPVLRMYEWERVRMVPFQIDAFLPDGSEFLFVRVKIVNPNENEVPMYWWSNIAVPETPDTRVIVPAESILKRDYKGNKSIVSISPDGTIDGIDLSYPVNFNRSADNFYYIKPESQPWITSLDKDGKGLIQTSTKKLYGRKLFVWGMHKGGRSWQEFLSVPGSAYIEIQAGLTQTQSEYIQMPAGAEWSWLEAYGLMECTPEVVHGKNWKEAYNSVDKKIKSLMSEDNLESILTETAKMANKSPDEIIQRGSGWGTLERIRREKYNEPPFCSEALIFDDVSLKKEQEMYLELLISGLVPYVSPKEKIYGWMIQKQWKDILEKAVEHPQNDHWLSWLHLGIMYYSQGNFEKAKNAWEKSLEREPSAWVYRNLGILAKKNNHIEEAGDLLIKAVEMAPDVYDLTVECCNVLIGLERYEDLLKIINNLSSEIRNYGRIKIIEAQVALKQNNLERVEEILKSRPSIPDIREGEQTLSDIWFEMHERIISKTENIPIDENLKKRVREKFPPPAWLDFRQFT